MRAEEERELGHAHTIHTPTPYFFCAFPPQHSYLLRDHAHTAVGGWESMNSHASCSHHVLIPRSCFALLRDMLVGVRFTKEGYIPQGACSGCVTASQSWSRSPRSWLTESRPNQTRPSKPYRRTSAAPLARPRSRRLFVTHSASTTQTHRNEMQTVAMSECARVPECHATKHGK